MAQRILENNGINNTNIDGAFLNNYLVNKSGILTGRLNNCLITKSSSNVLSLNTGELILSGFRIVIDDIETFTYSTPPSVTTNYALIAEIVVDDNSDVTFSFKTQLSSTVLIKNNLFATATGAGTYQIKLCTFDLTTVPEIENLVLEE